MRNGILWSLGGHAVGLAIVLAWPSDPADPAPAPAVIDIVAVDAPPQIAPAGHAGVTPGPIAARTTVVDPAAGRSGRHARSMHVADHAVHDPYAELVVSYDRGTELAGGAGTLGDGPGRAIFGNGYDGVFGDGRGGGGGGGAALAVPVPSLARGPIPRKDYSRSAVKFHREYAGHAILVDLAIDANGDVTRTHLLQGIGVWVVQQQVMDAVREYKFWPALDAGGHPIPSSYHWLWILTNDDDD